MNRAVLPLKVRLLQRLLLRIRPAFLAACLKRLMRIERVVVQTPVGTFWLDPISDFGRSVMAGDYEADMIEALERFLRPGSVFVDVGANEGCFSVVAARIVGASGRVIAIEPQERLKAVLQENIRLNDLSNVVFLQVAVSDVDGAAELFLSPDTNSGASGLARATRYPVPKQRVNTTTLAQVFATAGVREVDFLKMDIEGFEYEAVLGSRALFTTGQIKAIALQLHPPEMRSRGRDPADLVGFLRECGYRMEHPFTIFVWNKT